MINRNESELLAKDRSNRAVDAAGERRRAIRLAGPARDEAPLAGLRAKGPTAVSAAAPGQNPKG